MNSITQTDILRSIINKLINVENPTYTEAELLIIKDSTDRYNKEILCEYCGYLKPDHEERCIKKDDDSIRFKSQVATGMPASTSLDDCPFHYCDKKPKCEGKCRYAESQTQ